MVGVCRARKGKVPGDKQVGFQWSVDSSQFPVWMAPSVHAAQQLKMGLIRFFRTSVVLGGLCPQTPEICRFGPIAWQG
jgi:hypothetical protein